MNDDFNIGGESCDGVWILIIMIFALVGSILFLVATGCDLMKYYPNTSVIFLLIVLYGLYKLTINDKINDFCWPLIPAIKWVIGLSSIILIFAILLGKI